MPVNSATVSWQQAEIALAGPVTQGQIWTISLTTGGTPQSFSYTARTGDDLTAVAKALAGLIDLDAHYFSDIKYDTVGFTAPWPAIPVVGSGYFITPVNNNFLVNEATQVDVLNVYNNNSPASDVGTITANRVYGFGMGGDAVISGKAQNGGITYTDLEQLNLMLGSGGNHVDIESTHLGTTTITGGAGNDVFDVKTISGHTFINGGGGVDTFNVGSSINLADQITGLLSINGGGNGDVLNVNDSGDTTSNAGTLTASTLTGLGMPTVQEVQTFRVQAQSGNYLLALADPTAPGGMSAPVSFTYDAAGTAAGLQAVQTAMQTLFGTPDLVVSEVGRELSGGATHAITYAVTFVGSKAGIDMPSIVWAETPTTTSLAAYTAVESANITVSTERQGTTNPQIGNVQTFAVDADSGTFTLTLNVADLLGNPTQTTAAIAYNATAAQVLAALNPILNPNNTDNSKPYTNNVAVSKIGNVITVVFQGAYAGNSITAVDTSQLFKGTAAGTVYRGYPAKRYQLLRHRHPQRQPGQRRQHFQRAGYQRGDQPAYRRGQRSDLCIVHRQCESKHRHYRLPHGQRRQLQRQRPTRPGL